jgi:DNA invertase Pin-like site-specific DNA recombinase
VVVASLTRTQPRYAVAIYRVSTAEQGQSGLGMEAQQASVRTFIGGQGWTLVAEFSDVASGKDDRRPGFQAALARCRQLGAMLVAARLDRITRRAHTLSQLPRTDIRSGPPTCRVPMI